MAKYLFPRGGTEKSTLCLNAKLHFRGTQIYRNKVCRSDEESEEILYRYQRYLLTKYGSTTNTTPVATSTYTFEIKYGNINKEIPTKSGTTAFCFLP